MFKVGDRVKLKKGLIVGDKYDYHRLTKEMYKLNNDNEFLTIEEVKLLGYSVKEEIGDYAGFKYVFTEPMLEYYNDEGENIMGMNLRKKLNEIKKELIQIGGLNKDAQAGDNKFGYKYVSGNQILGKIAIKMNELGVMCYPSIDKGTLTYERIPYTVKSEWNGKVTEKEKVEYIVSASGSYVWSDCDSDETIDIPWHFVGNQDGDPSKAYGSALTYSERYFLLKFFGIPTDELDPDAKPIDNNSNVSNKSTGKSTSSKKSTPAPASEGNKCVDCGCDVPPNVANFSNSKFGKTICFNCQKKAV